MICFRCSHDNPPNARFCGRCQLILPVNLGEAASTSSLELHEGRSYPPVQESYPNPALEALREALEQFYAGTGNDDAVVECADELQQRFNDLAAAAPEMLAAVRDQIAEHKDDDEAHHLAYLVRFGCQIFGDAMGELDRFLDGEGGEPSAIVAELQKGSDYLCHSAALARQMLKR